MNTLTEIVLLSAAHNQQIQNEKVETGALHCKTCSSASFPEYINCARELTKCKLTRVAIRSKPDRVEPNQTSPARQLSSLYNRSQNSLTQKRTETMKQKLETINSIITCESRFTETIIDKQKVQEKEQRQISRFLIQKRSPIRGELDRSPRREKAKMHVDTVAEDEEKWLAEGIAGVQQNAYYMHRALVSPNRNPNLSSMLSITSALTMRSPPFCGD